MMRNAVLLSMALIVALWPGPWAHGLRAASGPGDAAGEIRSLELAHNQAIARADAAVIDGMTRDDFTFITPRGLLLTKAQMLKGLADGAFRYEYRQTYDLRIRVYGDAAVVTGRSLHTIQENGRDSSDAYRFTRVYVREHGLWLAVAWQTTREEA